MKYKSLKVDIGVFAHNEEKNIGKFLDLIVAQDIVHNKNIDFYIIILANGCSDQTENISKNKLKYYEGKIFGNVAGLELSGKSRTWNKYVHELSRPEADFLLFCDSDTCFSKADNLSRLVEELHRRDELAVVTSRPVKDIAVTSRKLSLTERLIVHSAGGLYDWKKSIAGSLYAVRAEVARSFHVPIGLPGEDGFVRAMILTRTMNCSPDLSLIDGVDGVSHIYESEKSIRALIRHQTRLIIGSAVNAAVFHELMANEKDNALTLKIASESEDWLDHVLKSQLPNAKYGYVPTSWLTQRIRRFSKIHKGNKNMRAFMVLIIGMAFDFIVYINAQIKMFRGVGVGHW